MKTTIKQLNDQVFARANEHPELKTAMQQILQQVNEQSKHNGVAEISEKIAEYEEELKVIELKRTVKKLRAGLDNAEVEINPVDVEFAVPAGMEGVLKDIRPKPKKKGQ